MEKNKLNYITYLVIFCVILSFVGCFFLGTYFGEKETVTKTEEKNPDEEIFKSAKIEEYSIYTLTALYNFTQSSQRDFNEYLTNLSNSQKLYVAGLVNYLDEDNKYNNNINSYFNYQIRQIRKKENFIFSLLEKKNYDSISNKIVCAIKNEHPKFIYRAPFFQGIGAKIYNIFR